MSLKAKDKIPDREGVWKMPDGKEVEVYRLEPAMGQLCIWGPDVGCTYSGAGETQAVWATDEWQGHIPVQFAATGDWEFLRDDL